MTRAGPSSPRYDWSALLRDPSVAGVMTDFDGTLSAVVEDRDTAVPLPGAADAVAALAERFAMVAVVSGRPVEFLSSALPCPPGVVLAGLFGLQRVENGRLTVMEEAVRWQKVVAQVVEEACAQAPEGLEVEDQTLSLALHSRRAPHTSGWAQRWAATVADRTGLFAQPGRLSVELLPPIAVDKGTVVQDLAANLKSVCFFGDDVGDLAAFAALRSMRASGKTTICVGVGSPEQPNELADAVDVMVDGPPEAVEELWYLARAEA